VLRVGPDGEAPPDNPFPGSLVYVSGVRNVQAFDWRADGALAIADHGPSGELGRSGHDEATLAVAGANLGWPTIYGCQEAPGLVAPGMSFTEAMPPGGGSFYTGSPVPEWSGSFLVASLRAGHVHRFVFDAAGDVVDHETYLDAPPPAGFGRLRDLVVAPDGSVYVTTSNCDTRGTCPPERDKVIRIAR
jgi:glucose/arabinose dehydrogenase